MSASGTSTGPPDVDLLIKNARVLDVFSGRFFDGNLAVSGGRIVGFGASVARETHDLGGAWVVPGLIDAHVHIESSQLSPGEFARAVVPHGTTTVIADPHEIGNVLGMDGIRYLLTASEGLPLRVFLMAPSCVPSSPFETTGAVLGPEEIAELLAWERVLGLGEVMNYPGVVNGAPEVLAKIEVSRGRPIDGHAPGLSGSKLWAYAAAGPRTDHECTTIDEAREKLRAGLRILIREGTTARNLDALLPLLDERTAPFVHFCTDDRDSEALLREGSVDDLVRRAISCGVQAELAIAAATIHAARTYGLTDLGAIAPGYRADFLVLSDLAGFEVREVYVGGERVAADGVSSFDAAGIADEHVRETIHIDLAKLSFRLPSESALSQCVRVIGVREGQVLTDASEASAPCVNGEVMADPKRDLLKLAVVERHARSGAVGIGFVTGFGLTRGAIASSVAHDAHNVIVAGASDDEMRVAVKELCRIGGGQVVVDGENVVARLCLPIVGLMATDTLAETALASRGLTEAARMLGCALSAPFAALSFLALPVIPHLKLTDQGLVDVDRFTMVPTLLDS